VFAFLEPQCAHDTRYFGMRNSNACRRSLPACRSSRAVRRCREHCHAAKQDRWLGERGRRIAAAAIRRQALAMHAQAQTRARVARSGAGGRTKWLRRFAAA